MWRAHVIILPPTHSIGWRGFPGCVHNWPIISPCSGVVGKCVDRYEERSDMGTSVVIAVARSTPDDDYSTLK